MAPVTHAQTASEQAPAQRPQLVTLRARGKWIDGVRTAVHVRSFAPFVADEPAALGGTDQGPNPMEYVIGSLTSCLAVMVRLIAQEQRFEFTGLQIDAEGDLDLRGLGGVAGVRPDFVAVRGVVELVSPETEERLIALRDEVERRCPMYNLFKNAGASPQIEWRLVSPEAPGSGGPRPQNVGGRTG